jgi:CRISPR-associated protein Cmr2
MLGSCCSLSAGIAYGHYKTPLGRLLAQSRHMLEDLAKKRADRRSVALSHYSRNGVKTEFAMRWSETGPPVAHHQLEQVWSGFQQEILPKRLPYKLRELMPMINVALDRLGQVPSLTDEEKSERQKTLLQGFFRKALGKCPNPHIEESAFAVWKAGIDLYSDEETPRAVDGLLLCRYLAGGEEDEA